MNELTAAWMLMLGTGMQLARWVLVTARELNRRVVAAESRVERRHWERAGPPWWDALAWLFVWCAALINLGVVADWWPLT